MYQNLSCEQAFALAFAFGQSSRVSMIRVNGKWTVRVK